MHGSVLVGIMLVRPYFGLGLMITFLERVCMRCGFSGGEDGCVRELVGMGMGLGG